MKKALIVCICLLFTLLTAAQKEGQEFCEGLKNGSYFPLDIKKKKLLWGNTYYWETMVEKKEIGGKEYIGFEQKWENGQVNIMFLRTEDGVVYQFDDCCEEDTIRYDPSFELNSSWKTSDALITYSIVEVNATLKTPYCTYTGLLVIKANIGEGTFFFYYQKGYGYVGAKTQNQLISIATPEY